MRLTISYSRFFIVPLQCPLKCSDGIHSKWKALKELLRPRFVVFGLRSSPRSRFSPRLRVARQRSRLGTQTDPNVQTKSRHSSVPDKAFVLLPLNHLSISSVFLSVSLRSYFPLKDSLSTLSFVILLMNSSDNCVSALSPIGCISWTTWILRFRQARMRRSTA